MLNYLQWQNVGGFRGKVSCITHIISATFSKQIGYVARLQQVD